MSLQAWLENGWLVEHRPNPQEISDLMTAVDRDLADCQVPALSADWQFNIAYNAALQAATAALAAEGYRATREQHHFRVLHSLTFTIAADADWVALLDRFRKKRNIGTYERAGSISDHEASEILALAQRIRDEVGKWLRAKHPDLIVK